MFVKFRFFDLWELDVVKFFNLSNRQKLKSVQFEFGWSGLHDLGVKLTGTAVGVVFRAWKVRMSSAAKTPTVLAMKVEKYK